MTHENYMNSYLGARKLRFMETQSCWLLTYYVCVHDTRAEVNKCGGKGVAAELRC